MERGQAARERGCGAAHDWDRGPGRPLGPGMGVTRGPRVRPRRGPPGSLRSPPPRSQAHTTSRGRPEQEHPARARACDTPPVSPPYRDSPGDARGQGHLSLSSLTAPGLSISNFTGGEVSRVCNQGLPTPGGRFPGRQVCGVHVFGPANQHLSAQIPAEGKWPSSGLWPSRPALCSHRCPCPPGALHSCSVTPWTRPTLVLLAVVTTSKDPTDPPPV